MSSRRRFRIYIHGDGACEGCGAEADHLAQGTSLRSLDVRVPEKTYDGKVMPAGWCPLVLLCTDCWVGIADLLVPK